MTWQGRVAFSWADGFAYVPDQILMLAGTPDELEMRARQFELKLEGTLEIGRLLLGRFIGSGLDVPRLVRELRAAGATAQPNHVFFADACTCCPPHPAFFSACSGYGVSGNPLWANAGGGGPSANPLWANPLWANPLWANPLWANPLWANPLWANPLWANAGCAKPSWAYPLWTSGGDMNTFIKTGIRRSTAIPVDMPANWPAIPAKSSAAGPYVVVLDTGYATKETRPDFVPAHLHPSSDDDKPDQVSQTVNQTDDLLDPVAGHGTFIAGLIARIEPSVQVEVRHVVQPEGDVEEFPLIAELKDIAQADNPPALLNLSLSGYAFEKIDALQLAVAEVQAQGTVVVASAGNEGSCTPTYPASLLGVISVGAIGPDGPAPFSNYGPWVRACAPGVGLVSTFFNKWNGKETAPPGYTDPDNFSGWAQWTGTSFAAPVVVGALAHEMVARGVTAAEAVERLIDAPGLMRIPNLGTVVNVL